MISLPQNQQYYVWPSRNGHDENSNKRKQVGHEDLDMMGKDEEPLKPS